MSVNKCKINFNKKERIIFDTPKNYTESYIRKILQELKCNNIFIKRGVERNQDEIIFYNENYIRYTICQENNLFALFVYKIAKDRYVRMGEFESLTKANIKKNMQEGNYHKNLDNTCPEVLLKDYKEMKKIIEKSDKAFRNSAINEVLSDEEVNAFLNAISNNKEFNYIPKKKKRK